VLVVNTVSASTYIIVGHDRINWIAVVCIAIGSLIGGYFGARIGRRFSPVLLRSVIVILGIVAIWRILTLRTHRPRHRWPGSRSSTARANSGSRSNGCGSSTRRP